MNDQQTIWGFVGRTSDIRSKLVEAAANLFWAKGYEATSMSEILTSSGAGSGSFYHFFDSKESLLLAVLDDYLKKLEPAVQKPAFDKTNDPIERIFAVLDGYRQLLLGANFTLGCPIGNLVLEVGHKIPEVRKRTDLLFEAWRKMIQTCLVDASDRLKLTADEIQSVSSFVLTVMEGAIMQARCHQDIRYYDLSVKEFRNYFEMLLEKRKSTSHKSRHWEKRNGEKNEAI